MYDEDILPGEELIVNGASFYEAQTDRVAHLLARNDDALTTLLSTRAAVAELPGLDAATSGDFDTILKDLEALAARAHLYR